MTRRPMAGDPGRGVRLGQDRPGEASASAGSPGRPKTPHLFIVPPRRATVPRSASQAEPQRRLGRARGLKKAVNGRRYQRDAPASRWYREGEPGVSPGSPERPGLPTRFRLPVSRSGGRLQGGAVSPEAEHQRRLRRDSSRKEPNGAKD